MKLIVGLGNPGKKYDKTRHNVGFIVLDNFFSSQEWKEKFNGLFIKTKIKNQDVILLKPQTFMNLSGNAVQKFVDYYNVALSDILVIQDDLDQEIGSFKLKTNSSSGGHNGINSIIDALKTDNFARLKIGINNEYRDNTIDFVLSKFSKKDFALIEKNLQIFNEIIESFIESGIEKTMNIYNRK